MTYKSWLFYLRLLLMIFLIPPILSTCQQQYDNPYFNGSHDPRDDALAAEVNAIAESMLAAARGRPHDPRFDDPAGKRDLRSTPASEQEDFQNVNEPLQIYLTVIELTAICDNLTLRSNCAVYPDGRVGWINVDSRESGYLPESTGLAAASPAIAGSIERMTEALADHESVLPMSSSQGYRSYYGRRRTFFYSDLASRRRASLLLQTLGRVEWKPRIENVTVIVKRSGGGGGYIRLKSSLVVSEGRLVVLPPTNRSLR